MDWCGNIIGWVPSGVAYDTENHRVVHCTEATRHLLAQCEQYDRYLETEIKKAEVEAALS